MDPHKPALNQPPPAHNMSGPPQHPPPPHGIPPMGQPMPPRAMQPGYMLPRPAHTGSSVPMTSKPTQPSTMGPKPLQHPGGSSSPKPSQLPPNASQEKPQMSGPPKPATPPISSVPSNAAGKPTTMPLLIPAAGAKPMSQQQPYHVNEMHQQRPAQQPLGNQQPQQQVQQQQMQVNQQQSQQNQQLPSTAVQQHNQNLQTKGPHAQNPQKQENQKGPTPPVPDLISITKQPTSQPMLASQPPSISQNQNTGAPIKPTQNPNANPPVPPIKNSGNVSTPSINNPYQTATTKPTEHNKSPNVSITPAKPAVPAPKPEAIKSAEGSNTVTIIPSVRASDNSDKINDSIKKSIPDSSEANLNGVGPNKPPSKANVSSTKPIEQITSELRAANAALPSQTSNKSFAPSQGVQITPARANQQTVPLPKQSPPPPFSQKQPYIQQQNLPVKTPTQVSPNKPAQVALSTENMAHANQYSKPNQTAINTSPPKNTPFPTKSTTQLPSQPPPPTSSQQMSHSKLSANASVPPPTKSPTVSSTTKVTQPVPAGRSPIQENKNDVAPVVAKPPVPGGKQPRNRRLVEKMSPQNNAPFKDDEDDSMDDEEEEEEAPKRRATRNKRKVSETPSEGERKSRRSRNPAPIYQSPVPDTLPRITKSLLATPKTPQEKLVLFFKNEHVALRNAEGTFYLCQIAQNVYKSTRKIKIRWLSPTDENDENCDTFKADYFDVTDFDCILTSVALQKADKNVKRLSVEERKRILNILERAINRDKGLSPDKSELDENHPDGLDLSLYNDESQLKKRKEGRRKKKSEDSTSEEEEESDVADEDDVEAPESKITEKEEIKKEEEEAEPPVKTSKVSTGGRKTTRAAPAAPRGRAAAKKETPAPIPTPRRGAARKATPAAKGTTRTSRSTPVSNNKDVVVVKEETEKKVAESQEQPPAKTPRGGRASAKPPPAKANTTTPKTTRRTRK